MDMHDYTSHAEHMREMEAYEYKDKDTSCLFSELEDKLSRVYVSLVSDLQHYPCIEGRAETIHPKYHRWYVEKVFKTLYVNAKDSPYLDIVKNVYEGLLDKTFLGIWKLSQRERKTLYDIISTQRRYLEK